MNKQWREKKLAAVALIAAMLFSVIGTGCAGSGSGQDNAQDSTRGIEASGNAKLLAGDAVKEPWYERMDGGQPVTWMRSNAVTTNYVEDTEARQHIADGDRVSNMDQYSVSGNYVTVEGLVDKELQESINRKIYETYLELCQQTELPAYRGVKAAEKNELQSINVYNMGGECVGNLYSVAFAKYWNFRGESTWPTVVERRTLVFDLATGKQVPLAALFGDDVPYLEVLNQAVKKQLPLLGSDSGDYYAQNGIDIYDRDGLVQVTPFEGVRPDQPFVVNQQGIELFFDENDSEFETELGSNSSLYLYYDDMKESLVYPVRFAEQSELYENPSEEVFLVPVRFNPMYEKQESGDGYQRQYLCSYPENMSANARQLIVDPERERFRGELDDWEKEHQHQLENSSWSYIINQIYVTPVSDFYCVSNNVNASYDYDDNVYDTLNLMTLNIYDRDTLKPVSLKEMFRESFDLESFLRQQLQETMSNRGAFQEVEYTESEMCDNVQFALYNNGMSLYFPVNSRGESLSNYMNFSTIGPENLVLFQ